jgi:hypothetical protein
VPYRSRAWRKLAGRLVGEEQARAPGDGHRHGEALLLAAGEQPGGSVHVLGKAHGFQQGEGFAGARTAGGASLPVGEDDVLQGGGVGQDVAPGRLQHHAHLAGAHAEQGVLRHRADLLAADEYLPAGGARESGQQAEQRRLAGAGGPDQGDGLAGVHGEVDLAQGDDPGVTVVAIDVGDRAALRNRDR